jgi:hypothetical protein
VHHVNAEVASQSAREVLDGAEHGAEPLLPTFAPTGADAKALIRRHTLDAEWLDELAELRRI